MKAKMRPIIFHIPHAAKAIPTNYRTDFALTDDDLDLELLRMTDHFTDKLFGSGALPQDEVIALLVSRLLVDVERFHNDSEEPMSRQGMGMIYLKTHDGKTLRHNGNSRHKLFQRYYLPHHAKLEKAVSNGLSNGTKTLILDCHSFPSKALPYELNQTSNRPEICIGTDKFHTPPKLANELYQLFKLKGFTVDYDTPFSGSLVPSTYYKKDARVRSVMIELRRDLYMDENTGEKLRRFEEIQTYLREIISDLRY